MDEGERRMEIGTAETLESKLVDTSEANNNLLEELRLIEEENQRMMVLGEQIRVAYGLAEVGEPYELKEGVHGIEVAAGPSGISGYEIARLLKLAELFNHGTSASFDWKDGATKTGDRFSPRYIHLNEGERLSMVFRGGQAKEVRDLVHRSLIKDESGEEKVYVPMELREEGNKVYFETELVNDIMGNVYRSGDAAGIAEKYKADMTVSVFDTPSDSEYNKFISSFKADKAVAWHRGPLQVGAIIRVETQKGSEEGIKGLEHLHAYLTTGCKSELTERDYKKHL